MFIASNVIIYIKCDCVSGSMLKGGNEAIFSRFNLDKLPGHKKFVTQEQWKKNQIRFE